MTHEQTPAEKLLQLCEERARQGRTSLILLFVSWKDSKVLFPPGMNLGRIATAGGELKDMILFDLAELTSVARFMVELRK